MKNKMKKVNKDRMIISFLLRSRNNAKNIGSCSDFLIMDRIRLNSLKKENQTPVVDTSSSVLEMIKKYIGEKGNIEWSFTTGGLIVFCINNNIYSLLTGYPEVNIGEWVY